MDEEILRIMVIESTRDVFEKMLSTEVKKESEFNHQDIFKDAPHITASIGFAGGWTGSVMFKCSESMGYNFTSKLLYMKAADLNKEEVRDAMGELVNMIGGKFKSNFAQRFNQGKEAFKMSVPTVTMGKSFQIYNIKTDAVLELLLETQMEKFVVKIVLKKRSDNGI